MLTRLPCQDAHAATQNALFQITSQSEEETAGLSRQLEIAAEEMERAEERYLNLQQEKSSLLATVVPPLNIDDGCGSAGS